MAKKVAKKGPARPAKLSASSKPRKKGELFNLIADHTGLKRKDVAGVFDVLGRIMVTDLAKPAANKPRIFTVPGLMKVTSMYRPAQPARQGINPFTKEPTTFAAKPARTVVKVRPLKGLKSAV